VVPHCGGRVADGRHVAHTNCNLCFRAMGLFGRGLRVVRCAREVDDLCDMASIGEVVATTV